MKKTRFSEEQIIAVLREQEGGMRPPMCAASMGDQQRDALRVKGEVRRHGRVAGAQAERA